jgi:hypothetical protein
MRYEEVGELTRELGVIQARIRNLKEYISKVTSLNIPIHLALFTEKETRMVSYSTIDEDGFIDTFKREEDKYSGIKLEYRLTEKTALEVAAIILRGQKQKEAKLIKKIQGIKIET